MRRSPHTAWSLLMLSLLVACGDDDPPGGGDPDGGPSSDATTEDAPVVVPDANVPDASDDDGFDSDLPPGTDLSDLDDAAGQGLCEDVEEYTDAVLTAEQRLGNTCLLNTVFLSDSPPGTEEACEAAVDDCIDDAMVSPLFAELPLECGSVSTEACDEGATVGDLEDCVNSFVAFWELTEPYGTCEAVFNLSPEQGAALQAAVVAVGQQLLAGQTACQAVATACGAGFVFPDLSEILM